MRDYQKERRRRDPLVHELCLLGFTAREIAGATGWSHQTVNADVQRLGGMKTFSGRPEENADVFRAVLRRYADIADGKQHEGVDELWRILQEHPDILMLRAFVEGAAARQVCLLNVGTVLPEGYQKLLTTLFGEPALFDFLPGCKREVALGGKCFADFLQEVREGTVPENVTHARWRLAKMVIEGSAQDSIVLSFDMARVIALVEKALTSLTPREELVVRMRFGIGSEPMTGQQVADLPSLRVHRNRVSQIELKALRKLRRPTRFKPIQGCIVRAGALVKKCADLERDRARLEAEVAEFRIRFRAAGIAEPVTDHLLVLQRSVDALELSVRAANCLDTAKIRYIGELVQKSEGELLKVKNLGRITLQEIKEALAGLGYSIDMKIDNWKPPEAKSEQ